MDIQFILDHMNAHHEKDMQDLLAKFGPIHGAAGVHLQSATEEYIEIGYLLRGEKGVCKIDFPARAHEVAGIKNAIIALCTATQKTTDFTAVQKDLQEFCDSLHSVCLASLHPKGEVVCSYSALLREKTPHGTQYYIYISEVAEHFQSLKAHPDNVEVMFLEDEKTAKSPILRRRLRYKTRVTFIPRGAEFDRVYEAFLEKHGTGRGLETIRHMQDFHLVRLDFKQGRFVKGFGQAYDIDAQGKITYVGAQGNPHTMGKNPHHAKNH